MWRRGGSRANAGQSTCYKFQIMSFRFQAGLSVALVLTSLCARASDLAVLRNGFTIRHERRTVVGTVTRLYTSADDKSYVDVPTEQIEHFERDEERRVGKECRSWWSPDQ